MQAADPTSRPPVTLILGGARSGKSRYAESLAAQAERVLFVATATAVDEEMREKIARHRQDRTRNRLTHWKVLEEPLALGRIITQHAWENDVILIDCLTLYVASLLTFGEDHQNQSMQTFCAALTAPSCPVLLVSNEVGSGVVPEYTSGRRYRDLLGELNQRVAAIASDVILMIAGLPLPLKRGGALL